MSASPVLFESQAGNTVCTTDLDNSHAIGLSFIIVASFFSLFAVGTTIVLFLRNLIALIRSSRLGASQYFLTDTDTYFLSLLAADIVVALGGLLNIRWVALGRTECGGVCSAQGVFEQIGTPAAGLSTLVIAVHTFYVIFFKWSPPRRRRGIPVVVGIWMFTFFLVIVSATSHAHGEEPFYTPTPAWCYISDSHPSWRIGAGYLYAWLAALVSVVFYGLLWLQLLGRVDGQLEGWRIHLRFLNPATTGEDTTGGMGISSQMDDVEDEAPRQRERDAVKMLWYPLCYIVIILPLSAARWTSFTAHSAGRGDHVPFGVTAFTAVLFKLGGLADVLLFRLTRPNLLLSGSGGYTGSEDVDSRNRERTPADLARLSFASRRVHEENDDAIELRTLPSRKSDGLSPFSNDGTVSTSSRVAYDIPEAAGSLSELLPQKLMRKSAEDSRKLKIEPVKDGLAIRWNKSLPPSPRGPPGLELDLTREIDLHPVLGLSIDDDSERDSPRYEPEIGQPVLDLQESKRDTFLPISVEIPSSRLGSIYGSWVDMQREERLDADRNSVEATRGSDASSSRRQSDDSFQRLLSQLNDTSAPTHSPPIIRQQSSHDVPPLQLRPRKSPASGLSTLAPQEEAFQSEDGERMVTTQTNASASLVLLEPGLRMHRHPRGPRPLTRSRSSSDPLPSRHGRRQRPTVVTSVPRPSLTSFTSPPVSSPTPLSAFRRSPLGPIPEHAILRDLGSYNLVSSEDAGNRRRTLPRSSSGRRRRGRNTSFIDMD